MLKQLVAALAFVSAAAAVDNAAFPRNVELAIEGCFPLTFDFNNDPRVSVLKNVPRDRCADIALYLNAHFIATVRGLGCVLCKSFPLLS